MVTQAQGPVRKQSPLVPLSLSQEAGYLFGVTYVVVGMLGFALNVGRYDFAGKHGTKIIKLFSVNALHNIVHLGVGALLIVGAISGFAVSRIINGLVGLVYLAIGVVGWFVIGSSIDVIAINNWDNVLHLASGLVLLGAAGAPPPKPRPAAG